MRYRLHETRYLHREKQFLPEQPAGGALIFHLQRHQEASGSSESGPAEAAGEVCVVRSGPATAAVPGVTADLRVTPALSGRLLSPWSYEGVPGGRRVPSWGPAVRPSVPLEDSPLTTPVRTEAAV